MKHLFSSGSAWAKHVASGGALAIGLTVASTTAQASSLSNFVVDTTAIYTESDLEVVSADAFFFEASNVFAETFVAASLDGAGNIDPLSADDFDLDIVDFDFNPVINGRALDIAIDDAADTISILYEVIFDNTLSTDEFVVAELFFASFDILDTTLFLDLEGELVDLNIYGATVIPLPAGLPLMLAGLGGFAVLRRVKSRQKAS